MKLPENTFYGWLVLLGIFITLMLWRRRAKQDQRLFFIYLAALGGAFLGAKIVYLGAEGWMHWRDPDWWQQFLTGKSILGGLLGGYAAVEIAKCLLDYRAPTGDWFAVITPLGLMFGRVGCVLHGCCLGQSCAPSWFTRIDRAGVARWPAAEAELIFNVIALGAVLVLARRKILSGQLFHCYLVAYGLFRFAHEFLRATPRIIGPFTGYHIAALGVLALGIWGFWHRERLRQQPAPSPD